MNLPRLELEWFESPARLFGLRRDWDRWHQELGVDNVFQTWDWIRLWLRLYEPGSRLLVGVARQGREVVGLAPLFIAEEKVTPLGPTLRAVRILGDCTLCPDHIVIPVREGLEDALASAILDRLRSLASSWDRVELRDLRERQPIVEALHQRFEEQGTAAVVRERTHCPYITLPATWDEYLATLGAKTRKTIRQRLQKIERELSATLARPADRAEVDRFMLRLEDLHARAWEERGRAGVFAYRRFRTFHRLHSRRAFRSGRLWMLALRTPDRELAVTLGYRDAKAAHGYQLGHDPEYRLYGIGHIMVAIAIRAAIEEGLAEMDFLRGAGTYKYHLAHEERRGQDLIFHSGNVPDRTALAATRVRRGAGSALGALGPEQKQWIKRRLRMT